MFNGRPFAGCPTLALLAWTLAGAPADAAEWLVKPGESVAAAIARAGAGDTVNIDKAHYREHLRINKPLTLRGLNRPMLSGDNTGDVIRITSPDVVIDGLIVTDSGNNLTEQNAGIYIEPGADRVTVKNCNIAYSLFGMWIQGVNDVDIRHNLITGKRDNLSSQRGNGIQLYDTQRAKIVGNQISFVRDGLYIDVSHHALFSHNSIHHSRYGAHYMNSYNNIWEYNNSYNNRGGMALMEVRNQIVRHNRAWGNSDHGIMLRSIQDSVIEANVVAGNDRGFFIYDAEYNSIRGNLVVANHVGIHLWAGSKNNAVDGNDFIENREQIRYIASRDEFWGTRQGNYWSNYLGWDRNGDGIGDTPYEANDVIDRLSWRHPMMKLLMNSPAIDTLRLIARQFPLLRATSVIDRQPRMQPYQQDWRNWLGKERH